MCLLTYVQWLKLLFSRRGLASPVRVIATPVYLIASLVHLIALPIYSTTYAENYYKLSLLSVYIETTM